MDPHSFLQLFFSLIKGLKSDSFKLHFELGKGVKLVVGRNQVEGERLRHPHGQVEVQTHKLCGQAHDLALGFGEVAQRLDDDGAALLVWRDGVRVQILLECLAGFLMMRQPVTGAGFAERLVQRSELVHGTCQSRNPRIIGGLTTPRQERLSRQHQDGRSQRRLQHGLPLVVTSA